jgi:hypothetical protein
MKIQGRDGMLFRGEVRRWDGDRSIGPALWTSDPSGYFVRANPQSLADVEADPWIDGDQEFDVAYRATFVGPDENPVPLPDQPDPSVGQGAPPVVFAGAPSSDPAAAPAPAPEPQPAPVEVPAPGPVPVATPVVHVGQTPAQIQASKRCTVPDLHGKTLVNARRALARHGCALGTVKHRAQGRRVAHQGARAGRTLNRGSAVSVSLR